MALFARSAINETVQSRAAGLELGECIRPKSAGQELSVVLCYATVNHDHAAVLSGIRESVGPDVPIAGCSTQGVMVRGVVQEGASVVGAIGLGGSLNAAVEQVREIQIDTERKGAALGAAIRERMSGSPRVVVLHYDPLTGADMDVFLQGLHAAVGCPVIGGAAGQFWGPMRRTHQYVDEDVFSQGAVAVGFSGDFGFEIGNCFSGCEPVGIEMIVTRAEGNKLIELDGQPAIQVWQELCGCGPKPHIDHLASLAVGVRQNGVNHEPYLVRDAFGVDEASGALVLQAAIHEGERVMLHHREASRVQDGALEMGRRLRDQLGNRRAKAVLGFECGARTEPFLGAKATLEENVGLQELVGFGAEWLGMIAWGEICQLGARPEFFNYTFPVLVLTD